MVDGNHFRGVVDHAVTVVIVADSAIQKVVAQNAVERLGSRGLRPFRGGPQDMSCETEVAQARTSSPSSSTRHLSQVWNGPSCAW